MVTTINKINNHMEDIIMVVIIILMGQLVRASRLTNKSKLRLEKKSVGIIIMMIKVFVNFNRRDMAFIMVFIKVFMVFIKVFMVFIKVFMRILILMEDFFP